MTTPAAPAVYIHPDCDLSLLVIAVIQDAKRHAVKGDQQARAWLMGEGAAWLDALMGIHPDHVRRWARGKKAKQTRRPRGDRDRWAKYKKPAMAPPAHV